MASLLGIIYVSKAQIEFDPKSLRSLGKKAAGKNKQLGITGYLYFERGEFLQYFEGKPEEAMALMGTIDKDDRHQVLHQEQVSVEKRKFPEWHMQYLSSVNLREINMEHVLMKHLENFKRFKYSKLVNTEEVILRMIDNLSSKQSQFRIRD